MILPLLLWAADGLANEFELPLVLLSCTGELHRLSWLGETGTNEFLVTRDTMEHLLPRLLASNEPSRECCMFGGFAPPLAEPLPGVTPAPVALAWVAPSAVWPKFVAGPPVARLAPKFPWNALANMAILIEYDSWRLFMQVSLALLLILHLLSIVRVSAALK